MSRPEAMPSGGGWQASWVFPALVAGVIVVWLPLSAKIRKWSDQPSQKASSQTEEPAAEALALLAPLRPGETVGGFQLVSMHGPDRGAIELQLRRANGYVRVWVARSKPDRPATRKTKHYSITYGSPLPGHPPLGGPAGLQAVAAIAGRVAANEDRVSVPKGM